MLLYHISFEQGPDRKLFIPKIPESSSKRENKTVRRICAAPTIEQALQARTDWLFDKVRVENNGKYIYDVPFKAYGLNTEGHATIGPQTLYEECGVADAAWTGETWLLSSVGADAENWILEYYVIGVQQALYAEQVDEVKKLLVKELAIEGLESYLQTLPAYDFAMVCFSRLRNFLAINRYSRIACAKYEDLLQNIIDDVTMGSGVFLENIKIRRVD